MGVVEDREELRIAIEFELDRLSERPPLEIAVEVCDYLCLLLRTEACCHVLVDGDQDSFFHTLRKSADVRRYYLHRVAAADSTGDPLFALSNGPAFFDALAARDFDTADEIAAASSQDWQKDSEYEDDFCFYKFFHLLVAPGHNDPTLKQILARFEAAVEGEQSARLQVCGALLSGDQQAFESSIDALLEERAAELEFEEERFFTDRIVFDVKRHIYVEGLAILNVADRLGLETREEYRYCPQLCRLQMQTPFPSSSFVGDL